MEKNRLCLEDFFFLTKYGQNYYPPPVDKPISDDLPLIADLPKISEVLPNETFVQEDLPLDGIPNGVLIQENHLDNLPPISDLPKISHILPNGVLVPKDHILPNGEVVPEDLPLKDPPNSNTLQDNQINDKRSPKLITNLSKIGSDARVLDSIHLRVEQDFPPAKAEYVCKNGRMGGPIEEKKYFCDYCTFGTKYAKSLREHVVLHKSKDEVPIFKCYNCDYETKRKSYLKKHTMTHMDNLPTLKCPHCDYSTKRTDGMKRHKILMHDTEQKAKLFKCHLCKYQTKLSYSLTSHLLTHDYSDEAYKYCCDLCPYKTKEKRALGRHQVIHRGIEHIPTFNCTICPFKTRRKAQLTKHQTPTKLDIEGQNHKCSLCTLEFALFRCLRCHVVTHRNENNLYKCPHCPYAHTKKKKLMRHLPAHSDTDDSFKHRCTECPYKTKWVDALHTHQLRHVKEEDVKGKFMCGICSYNARNKAHLTRHRKIHRQRQINNRNR